MTKIESVPDDMHTITPHLICAGAGITLPVADMFWGDRYGKLENPFGHQWPVVTPVRDVNLDQARQAMQQMGRRSRFAAPALKC